MRRVAFVLAVPLLFCLGGCERVANQPAPPVVATGMTLQPGFQDQIVVAGLTQPTAVRFAKDGRIFIAEKSGLVKVFDPKLGGEPSVFADLRTNVHNYWDRGLLDLELDPDFPNTPYIYVLYVYDGALDEVAPRWGSPGATSDRCPTPPGAQDLGCVVSGRLSRLEAAEDGLRGGEQVLVANWPMQFPSHAMGSLAFGPDGMLYVSAGDGASFDFVDYGQVGDPPNVLGDPPVPLGQAQTPPAARGGAVRAQNIALPGSPVHYNGKVLRLDPKTGRAAPNNPLQDGASADAAAIVAVGLRNPFRLSFRPNTSELWIADVGWGTWEEIDRLQSPIGGSVANFGWPCFEGAERQSAYEATNLDACNALYAQGGEVAPYYAYRHDTEVVEADGCGTGSGAITGLAFYEDGLYPTEYRGALFFADYSRNCIFAMMPGTNGLPDPNKRRVFGLATPQPVQLLLGPGNDLYYTSIAGSLHRIAALGANRPPLAAFSATPAAGPAPLTLTVDATASTDPDTGDTISYAWDLDGDGSFDDASGATATYVFSRAGARTITVKVTDSRGAESTASKDVSVTGEGGIAEAHIDMVAPLQFKVGDIVHFEGTGIEDGAPLPAANLQWDLVIQHCPVVNVCHPHVVESFSGSQGEFHAPDHEYPYYLDLILRVTGSDGQQSTAVTRLDPRTVDITLDSAPHGLTLAFNHAVKPAPFTTTVAAGSSNTVSAPDFAGYRFVAWSSMLAQTALYTAPDSASQLVATYAVSAQAAELKQFGSVIARLTQPMSSGSRNLDVIRDDEYPPPGTVDPLLQYDSWVETSPEAKEDWLGYEYPALYVFSGLVFREGRNFLNGGWFESLDVRVRRDGVWAAVSGSDIQPSYPGTSDGVGFRSYRIAFAPTVGDAIAIFGPAGGDAHFISCAELDAYGRRATVGYEHPPVAQVAALSGDAIAGERITLDGGGSYDLDGDALTYAWAQTQGPTVALSSATGARTSFVAPALQQRTSLRFALTVQDGALTSTAANVEIFVAPTTVAVDVSMRGRAVVSEPAPAGSGGSPSIEVIRDGVEPPQGSTDWSMQYDNYAQDPGVIEAFVGYELDQPYRFSRLHFQAGGHYGDGGWFDSLTVQIRQGGRYHEVDALRITPAYASGSGTSFETYELSFTPAVGDGIRIYGPPGGTAHFFSVAELRAFAVGPTEVDAVPLSAAGEDFSAPDNTQVSLEGALSWDPDGNAIEYSWQQTAGPTVMLSDSSVASPTFVTPYVASPTELTFRLVVRDAAQSSAPDSVTVTVERTQAPVDVTASAAIIASERKPAGGGNTNLEVIRDGTRPDPNATDANLQYATYTGRLTNQGFIGYKLPTARTLASLQFQEGLHYLDGGWFELLFVQALRGGVWTNVDRLTFRPNYPGAAGTQSWQSYELRFTPVVAEGIRLFGLPGGSARFFSVAELRAFTP